jgi:hypothetical protein
MSEKTILNEAMMTIFPPDRVVTFKQLVSRMKRKPIRGFTHQITEELCEQQLLALRRAGEIVPVMAEGNWVDSPSKKKVDPKKVHGWTRRTQPVLIVAGGFHVVRGEGGGRNVNGVIREFRIVTSNPGSEHDLPFVLPLEDKEAFRKATKHRSHIYLVEHPRAGRLLPLDCSPVAETDHNVIFKAPGDKLYETVFLTPKDTTRLMRAIRHRGAAG